MARGYANGRDAGFHRGASPGHGVFEGDDLLDRQAQALKCLLVGQGGGLAIFPALRIDDGVKGAVKAERLQNLAGVLLVGVGDQGEGQAAPASRLNKAAQALERPDLTRPLPGA